MTMGSNHPLTEMSTRKSFWGIARPACKADLASVSCLENVGASMSQPYGPPRSVRGIALPFKG
jgi:hypothetical protein